MIDAELVTRKIVLIVKDLGEMQALAGEPRERFLASRISVAAAERYLERVIGRMIDINFHLITETGHPPPSDYYQSFLDLGSLAILDPTFARQIASAAGLRNRIAHDYEEIDESKVYDGVHAALRDIPIYLRQVNAWLEQQPGDAS
jgi:uncharacterized protein YutE (UPF0331/DUF86 family)